MARTQYSRSRRVSQESIQQQKIKPKKKGKSESKKKRKNTVEKKDETEGHNQESRGVILSLKRAQMKLGATKRPGDGVE